MKKIDPKFKSIGAVCDGCGHRQVYFSEYFEAYACLTCDEWLEKKSKENNDERPETPNEFNHE